MKNFLKKNQIKLPIVFISFSLLVGWYYYNTENYTFYYSSSEKEEITDDRNNRKVLSLKLEYDDCFWKVSSECYELMRGLKFKGFISNEEWVFIDEREGHLKLTSRAKDVRLGALNKWYDERAEEESGYKDLKHFNQFVFEEILIFLAMISVLYVLGKKDNNDIF